MEFVDDLSEDADEYWSAMRNHPMVVRLGDGTLDEDRFRFWVKQDYRYLIEYSRVLAYGAARAPDVRRLSTFAELLDSTVTTEMDLHRKYASEFGISQVELERTEPSPTTRAYTDFLVRTAATGSFADLSVALLPCEWGFNEVARRLDADGRPDHDRYAEWIETYSGAEFTRLAEWAKGLVDEVTAGATEADRERYRRLFETSAQFEYLFWDAAWNGEEWPL